MYMCYNWHAHHNLNPIYIRSYVSKIHADVAEYLRMHMFSFQCDFDWSLIMVHIYVHICKLDFNDSYL